MKLIKLGFLAMVIAIPVTVYAQGVTTYDGTYRGVSMKASGGNNTCVSPAPAPPTLTISNGAVQWSSTSPSDPYRGTVTAQGAVSAKRAFGSVFTGKIEGGTITGGSNYGGSCTITFVWQKQ